MEFNQGGSCESTQRESKAQLIKRLDRMHMRRNALRRDLQRIDDEIDEAESDLNNMDRWR